MFDELTKKEQLIFLAGLFEGEGWFGIQKKKEGHTPAAVLEVQMSDEEIETSVRKAKKKKHTTKIFTGFL